jgi:cobalt-zinc-cadmium efflux system outer membrane protein
LLAQSVPDHPLTLDEVISTVRARNQSLISARNHLDAIKANEVTAGLRPNPVFSSANEDFNVFDPSRLDLSRTQEFTQNFSLLLERGHKRQFRIEGAKLASIVAESTFRDGERQIVLTAKQAFVAMLLAKANLSLAQQNVHDYAQTVKLNEIRFKAGDISRTDFDRIVLQQAKFENDLLSAQLALAQTRTQLQALLGIESFSSTFDIQGSLAAAPVGLGLPELQTMALANRPDILAARDSVRKAGSDVNLANAGGVTDVIAGTEYKRNGPDNTIGFTFQVPLKIFDRNQGEKLRTRRELDASKANEISVRTQVLSDVDQAYAAYQSALLRADLYNRDYLKRAKDVRDRIEFSFRNGGSTLLDYIDAVRDYRDTELASRSADAQVLNAINQLSFATGTEILP